jgi:hypothetical protein
MLSKPGLDDGTHKLVQMFLWGHCPLGAQMERDNTPLIVRCGREAALQKVNPPRSAESAGIARVRVADTPQEVNAAPSSVAVWGVR